jgi:hypothetical protein
VLLLQARKYRENNNTKAMTGRQKKIRKPVPHSKKLVQELREMKKTDTQIQTPTK